FEGSYQRGVGLDSYPRLNQRLRFIKADPEIKRTFTRIQVNEGPDHLQFLGPGFSASKSYLHPSRPAFQCIIESRYLPRPQTDTLLIPVNISLDQKKSVLFQKVTAVFIHLREDYHLDTAFVVLKGEI